MPNYEISCHRDDGTMVLKYSLQCTGDVHARSVANTIRSSAGDQIQVWRGEMLIYEEPKRTPH